MDRYNAKHGGKQRRGGQNRIFIAVVIPLLVAVVAFAGYKLYTWLCENAASRSVIDEVQSAITVADTPDTADADADSRYEVDFERLLALNPDTVGYLRVEGTAVSYPVVQSGDNDFYLTHSFDGAENSAGWVFLDFRDHIGQSRNLVIYGHNRRDGSMFGSLSAVLDDSWCDNRENRILTFVTPDDYARYEVFSVYTVKAEDYYITTDFADDESYAAFLTTIRGRSVYDFGVEVGASDTILTLSTCSNVDSYRTVLHARRLTATAADGENTLR